MRKLIITGAGLSDDLISLRGFELLKNADVVLYDRLINKKILDGLSAELIDVGKIPYKKCTRQSDINALIKKYLLQDKVVVRLKGGDSTIFARSIEEIDVANKLNAEVEIVPGVTSAATLSAKLKSALTDRNKASGVIFLTGHSKPDKDLKDAYNWQALASLNLTIVIYMGIKNMPLIGKYLIDAGMKEDTPVVIGENLETDDERILQTTLKNAPEFIINNNVKHPATIIIGDIFK